jgi:hypothetical protein
MLKDVVEKFRSESPISHMSSLDRFSKENDPNFSATSFDICLPLGYSDVIGLAGTVDDMGGQDAKLAVP